MMSILMEMLMSFAAVIVTFVAPVRTPNVCCHGDDD